MHQCLIVRFLRLMLFLNITLSFAAKVYGQTTPASPAPGSETEPGPPILQFLLAAIALGLILMILMMPTRKSQ